ncbi:MAG: glucosamine-6-phosphate deaminase [Pirellulales bacterium]
MEIAILSDRQQMGRQAAAAGAGAIRAALAARGAANIIVATGASQFEMLAALVAEPDVDWSQVTGFHLDEYIGIPITHPASFRKYLKERFVDQAPLAAFHYLNTDQDPAAECRRVGAVLQAHPIDVAFVGIGENGHLAFNDPPADFETEEPYIIVELDDACRRQQLGEGWFATLDEVPQRAVSMSVKQILQSKQIICTVPDARKAVAVRDAVGNSVTPHVPASILQTHPHVMLYLDEASASLLPNEIR